MSVNNWTYVVTGEVRSGVGAVISGINSRAGTVCRTNLFHPDVRVRSEAHEKYLGPSVDPINWPQYYQPGEMSAHQYLTRDALVASGPETSVGCHLTYAIISQLELYDFFEEECREGGFGLIHVVRNPVACFVSYKQAQKSGIWHNTVDAPRTKTIPMPVWIDPEEFVPFCRRSQITRAKIKASCTDQLEVSYDEIVTNYYRAMETVFDHIEIPELPVLTRSEYLRLPNLPLRARVNNWLSLLYSVPEDVKELIRQAEHSF